MSDHRLFRAAWHQNPKPKNRCPAYTPYFVWLLIPVALPLWLYGFYLSRP